MLGSLILYLKGMRRMMFQLSGFYCKLVSLSFTPEDLLGEAREFWGPRIPISPRKPVSQYIFILKPQSRQPYKPQVLNPKLKPGALKPQTLP